MLCSLPRSCLVVVVVYCILAVMGPNYCHIKYNSSGTLVHTVHRFDSEGWFSCDQVITFNVFRVFLVKSMQHLSENKQFPVFLFPQVVQKH